MKKYIFIVALAASIILAGCGGSSAGKSMASEPYMAKTSEAYYDDYEYAAVAEEAMEEAYYDDNAGLNKGVLTDDPGEAEAIENSANADAQSRKLIKTVNMSVETEEFDALIDSLEKKIISLGGYAESINVSGNSYSYSYKRSASMTARIPAAKLDEFVDGVSGQTNVVNKSENVDDVTLNYVDMQAKKESLKTEYDRLNQLLEQADSLETIIALEERLAEVRYEIESYESRLRVMENQVTYSTVYLDISEVVEYTPVVTEKKTVLERMGEGFVSSCKSIGEGLKNFLVFIVSALPFIILIALIAGIVFLIVMACIKSSAKIRKKRIAKRAEKLNMKAKAEKEKNAENTEV